MTDQKATQSILDRRDELAAECGAIVSTSSRDKFDIGRISYSSGFDSGLSLVVEDIKKYKDGMLMWKNASLDLSEKIKELEAKLTNYMLGFATQTERCELLEAKLSIAVEALEFYAHADNWTHIEPGTHYVTNIYQCVDKTDYGEGDFTISERMNIDDSGVGGKRARQALKEFKSKVGVK